MVLYVRQHNERGGGRSREFLFFFVAKAEMRMVLGSFKAKSVDKEEEEEKSVKTPKEHY